MQRRQFISAAAGLSLLPRAHAQPRPTRPIKVLQGFAAGGNADTIARVVNTMVSAELQK